MMQKNEVPTVSLGTTLRRIEALLERQGRENQKVTRKLKALRKRKVRVTVK